MFRLGFDGLPTFRQAASGIRWDTADSVESPSDRNPARPTPASCASKDKAEFNMPKRPALTTRSFQSMLAAFLLLTTCNIGMAQSETDTKPAAATKVDNSDSKDSRKSKKTDGWQPLFEKSSLKGWKITNYGGEGEAEVVDGVLSLEQGVDLSGITTTRKDLLTDHYEVEFEARRTQGNDFFVGFTFPVRDSACTLICGGWGGGVCGISSIGLMDASENDTTSYSAFNNGQWYKVKLKVDGQKIEAWMDGKSLLDVELDDRDVDTRFEMDLSKPMGFATYQSTAEIRKARYRSLKQPAKKPAAKEQDSAAAKSDKS